MQTTTATLGAVSARLDHGGATDRSGRSREPTHPRTTMGGAVADRRSQTEQHTDRSSFAERNERVRIERLHADAKRPPEELLEETLRLAKFLSGVADSARRDGDV